MSVVSTPNPQSPEFALLQRMVSSTPAAIAILDRDMHYVAVSDRWRADFVLAGDLVGRSHYEVSPHSSEEWRAIHRQCLAGQPVSRDEALFVHPDGREQYLRWEIQPWWEKEGVVGGIIIFGEDITDRVNTERKLKRETELLDTIIKSSESLSANLKLENIVQEVTDAATRLSGAQFGAFFYNLIDEKGESYTLYTISGVPREHFSKFPMPRNTAVFDPTFKGLGTVRSGDITKDARYGKNAPYYGKPKGHLPVCSYLAVPVTSRKGEVFGGLFFGHAEADKFSEVHERLVEAVARQAGVAIENARLFESEQRARTRAEKSEAVVQNIWASMTDAFVFLDREWRYQYCNEKACELLGKSTEELIGQRIWDLFPDVVGTQMEKEFQLAVSTRQARHAEIHLAQSNTWFELHAYPSQEGLSIYFRNVTEQKLAGEEASKILGRLQLVTTSTDMGTWYCDLPFDKLQWSAKTKEHFWLPENAEVTIDTFYERLHPDDRERTRAAIANSVASHGTYDIDYRTVSDRGEIKWIRAIGRTFYGADDTPISFDGITVDQTARKAADEALRRTEQLATAGRLAATVAHEVNNPLEAVTNIIYLCQNDASVSDSARAYLKLADEELRRVAHIVRQTLGFYRDSSAPEPIDLSLLVADLSQLYQRRFKAKNVELVISPAAGVVVTVVASEIRQVIANLLSNALDASSPESTVHLTVKHGDDNAQIEIRDQGHGIAAENWKKLFEPFFTTKREVGTGLGLWVSKNIVEKHKGTIRVDSSTSPQNHGTTFTIVLPLQAGDARAQTPAD